MAKAKLIKKSRKSWICSSCGKTIPVGSSYYKGEIAFNPTIIRCTDCGLNDWEVTSSEYQKSVGEIVHLWQETYGVTESSPEDVSAALEDIKNICEDNLDNIPENLQENYVATLLQERIDSLESAIDLLDAIDIDDLKQDVAKDYSNMHLSDEEKDMELSFDDIIDRHGSYTESKLNDMLESAIEMEIDEALSELEV